MSQSDELRFDRPLTLALVEDDEVQAMVYRKALEREESVQEVTWFSDAQSFRQHIGREMPYDCVIIDMRLPDINGDELAKYLRHNYPELPIIFLTAYANAEEAQSTLTHGADDYLPKNQDTIKLLARSIHYAIERRAAFVKHQQMMIEYDRVEQQYLQQYEFLTAMHHELRTPLAILGSAIQLSKQQIPQKLLEEGEETLGKALNAYQRVTSLVEKGLEAAHIPNKNNQPESTPLEIVPLFTRMVDNYRMLFPQIQLELEIVEKPTDFTGNAAICRHLFLHFLSLLMNYADPGSEVVVTIDATEDSCQFRTSLTVSEAVKTEFQAEMQQLANAASRHHGSFQVDTIVRDYKLALTLHSFEIQTEREAS